MQHASHQGQLARLRRIHGQVAGLIRMVEQERYCVDILTQIRAARAALRRVEEGVLREHAEHCIAGTLAAGNRADADAKMSELFEALARFAD